MTNTTEKSCIACGLSIQSQAHKCPHCRTWQTKWTLAAAKPVFPLAIFILVLALFGGMFYDVYSSIYKHKETFLKYQDALAVTDSKYNFTEGKTDKYITCIGHLKNNTNVPWEDLRFEVQFFNKGGELIDTISEKNYNLLIPPHAEATFRVRDTAACDQDQYVNHKVFIRWAKKAK